MKVSYLKKTRILLFFFALQAGGNLLAAETWKEVKSESGVVIYERWVKLSGDLTVRERKGEMTINGCMNSVVSLLRDPSNSIHWMENVSDAYLVRRESDREWASYTYFSLPWPFENRDMVAVSHLNYCSPTYATIEMTSRANDLPVKKNVKRLTDYKATWKITDLGNGRIFISLSAISFTSPEFPRFIQDPVVRGVFMRNMLKLKGMLCV
jgi:hypothetical protein